MFRRLASSKLNSCIPLMLLSRNMPVYAPIPIFSTHCSMSLTSRWAPLENCTPIHAHRQGLVSVRRSSHLVVMIINGYQVLEINTGTIFKNKNWIFSVQLCLLTSSFACKCLSLISLEFGELRTNQTFHVKTYINVVLLKSRNRINAHALCVAVQKPLNKKSLSTGDL